MSQTWAKVQFDFAGNPTQDQLTISAGQELRISQKGPPGGWSRGAVVGGKEGFFPTDYATFFEKASEPPAPPPSLPTRAPPSRALKVRALYDYNAQDSSELTFKCGDIITVESKDGDWWMGTLNGTKAQFPSNYVETITNMPDVEPPVVADTTPTPKTTTAAHTTTTTAAAATAFSQPTTTTTTAKPQTTAHPTITTTAAAKPTNQQTTASSGYSQAARSHVSAAFSSSPAHQLDLNAPAARVSDGRNRTSATTEYLEKQKVQVGDTTGYFTTATAFAHSNKPIWKHTAFVDIFGDAFVPPDYASALLSKQPPMMSLSLGLDLMVKLLKQMYHAFFPTRLKHAMTKAQEVFTNCSNLCVQLPANTSDPQKFSNFLNALCISIRQLNENDIILIPGGWSRGLLDGHMVMFVLAKKAGNKFHLAVCNMGAGLAFHPTFPNPINGCVQHNVSLALHDIPASKVADSTFWFMALHSLVFPQPEANPAVLYQTLLPHLTNSSIPTEAPQNVPWRQAPLGSDASYSRLCKETLFQVLLWSGCEPNEAEFGLFCVDHILCEWINNDIELTADMSSSDTKLVELAVRQVGNSFATLTDQITLPHATRIQSLTQRIQSQLEEFSTQQDTQKATLQQNPPQTAEQISGAALFPLFGRLRRDTSVEHLQGSERIPPILLPVELTLVPDSVETLNDVANALRHCTNLCLIMANQSELVPNSFCLRSSLITHLFTSVIPLPLSHTHPNKSHCFWNQPMRYETQSDILRLLSGVARHFSAACLSLKLTRTLDASRIITLGCMAVIADCVMRVKAVDLPSQLSLHYSGEATGPVHPFGFEISAFELEAEYLRFVNPQLCTALTQILDYFESRQRELREDHVIFRFEHSMEFGQGDDTLMDQLCVQLAIPRDLKPRMLSGEERILSDVFPELSYFRDIVFLFKLLQTPSSDDLPEIRRWHPSESFLEWSYKKDDNLFQVCGFGGKTLKCAYVVKEGETASVGILQKLGLKSKHPRLPPSCGNPSNLVDKPVNIEDDVLHIRHLPDFDGHLKPRDCELLLQYLTVPYMRIPLVLSFFADQMRISALGATELQDVVDACLFEPGRWHPNKPRNLPQYIPSQDRKNLYTPCGLLFNELQKSPETIIKSIKNMVEYATEMDVGRFSPQNATVILYVLRLAVRVEEYILYTILHNEWLQTQNANPKPTNCRFATYVRGLEADVLERISVLKSGQKELRALLLEQMFPMVRRWCRLLLRENEVQSAVLLQAHIAYIFKNFTANELTQDVVFALISSQVFLNIHAPADVEVKDRSIFRLRSTSDKQAAQANSASTIIPITELFDLFQKHRVKVYNWLKTNGAECNEVMENVVQLIVSVGSKDQDVQQHTRDWQCIDREGCEGRWVPDTDKPEHIAENLNMSFEDWMRLVTTQSVMLEINTQIGEFTLKKHPVQRLDDSITNHPDFQFLFSHMDPHSKNPPTKPHNTTTNNSSSSSNNVLSSNLQCAEVKNTTHRTWMRLVGRRHDVQLWDAEPRSVTCPFKRAYEQSTLKPDERWIFEQLEDVRRKYLNGFNLFLPDQPLSPESSFALLAAYKPERAVEVEKNSKQPPPPPIQATLLEVVVFRFQRVVHVFQVIPYGRRFFRQLVFSSDSTHCFQDLPSLLVLHDKVNQPHFVGGDHVFQPPQPEPSLVVYRNLTAELGTQHFVPPRLLHGLLPSCLLENYLFWQGVDDNLIGYQSATKQGEEPTIIHVDITNQGAPDNSGFGHANAVALIKRHVIIPDNSEAMKHLAVGMGTIDNTKPVHTLINLAHTSHPALLWLRTLLMQLENLSHILVWTTQQIDTVGEACSLAGLIIEFPRLALTFTTSTTSGILKLLSNDHPGLSISNERCSRLSKLLRGIPSFIILQDEDANQYVMISSAALPVRPHVPTAPFVTELLLDRANADWLSNLGDSRHYLYDVHPTRTFLKPNTLAATLYLMLLRFLNRQYDRVFGLIPACVTDASMSNEENQIFDQLEYLGHDSHPDAHACRLKLSLNVSACETMNCPWNVTNELVNYLRKRNQVSVTCRLSFLEEKELLDDCFGDANKLMVDSERKKIWLENHRTFVQSVLSGQFQTSLSKFHTAKTGIWFDDTIDKSVMGFAGKASLASKFQNLQYTRPQEPKLGQEGLQFFHETILAGVELKGSKTKFGFPFLYELLTNSLNVRILPDDSTHNLGCLMMRLLPEDDWSQKSELMSLLRILARNPQLCSLMPKFEDTRKFKIASVLGGKDIIGRLIRDCHKILSDKSSEIVWGTELSPPPPRGVVSFAIPQEHATSWIELEVDCACEQRFLCSITSSGTAGIVEIKANDVNAFGLTPLESLSKQLVTWYSPNQNTHGANLPFDVNKHTCAQSHIAKTIISRLEADVGSFAKQQQETKLAQLVGWSDNEIQNMLGNQPARQQAVAKIVLLIETLKNFQQNDIKHVFSAIDRAVEIASFAPPTSPQVIAITLSRIGAKRVCPGFDQLLSAFLSTTGVAMLRSMNPELTNEKIDEIFCLVASVLFAVARHSQLTRCLALARALVSAGNSTTTLSELKLKSSKLAEELSAQRHYTRTHDNRVVFDPRFAVFEYSFGLLLRKSQVLLVNEIMEAVQKGGSVCHQMIMGAGKTTVVGPLLALMLTDGKRLVMQVVPHALLQMSRSTMRERFSHVIRRPVYTFYFDRFVPITKSLLTKLLKARQAKAVVCASPTSVKAFTIKFIELMNTLDNMNATANEKTLDKKDNFLGAIKRTFLRQPKAQESVDQDTLVRQAAICSKIYQIFQSGCLILDEVDVILHPLKSELNWPLGKRMALDFTRSASGNGLRWQLPVHLLDAFFYCAEGKLTAPVQDSREATNVLAQLKRTVDEGLELRLLQRTPHLVLLSKAFYHSRLKPLLAQWLLIWLRLRRLKVLNDAQAIECLLQGVHNTSADIQQLVKHGLQDDHVKMLNLSHQWLQSLLPFVLSKIDRVSFGLLGPENKSTERTEPKSRLLLAVPFVGKDVPSRASEFSHPDVAIGLAVLAYRFEGLRRDDFTTLVTIMKDQMEEREWGPYHLRPTSLLYETWVEASGAKVRGSKRSKQQRAPQQQQPQPQQQSLSNSDNEVWPLHLINVHDDEQMDLLYGLLRKQPHAVEFYLNEFVFPVTMNHQGLKLSASGQELGSSLLFSSRIGFSGTPSDLVPRDLGNCHYEQGSDGKMLHFLTSPDVVSNHFAPTEWNVTSLLDLIAQHSPPLHALIDTGALITGMNNLEVARYLLEHGLPEMEGVVFLDDADRRMVLVRAGWKIVRLSQCGIPPAKRFTFYDQIHTTGMDIKQALHAQAMLTLGKDMVWRDYVQGAFRMRGIGQGQTIKLLIVPEIKKLITSQVAAGLGQSVDQYTKILDSQNDATGRQMLCNVAAWSVINQMRSEKIQFNLLCEQSVSNAHRKVAYGQLISQFERHLVDYNQKKGQSGLTFEIPASMTQLLAVFRESLDYTVENTVPSPKGFKDKLVELIDAHKNVVQSDPAAQQTISAILNEAVASEQTAPSGATRAATDDGLHDTGTSGTAQEVAHERAFNAEQVQQQEQEQEQEQQQEQEKEDEREILDEPEEFLKLKYTREEENPVPWPVSALGTQPNGNPFYPCSQFAVFKKLLSKPKPITFPPNMLMTLNHFHHKWSLKTYRRLKNIIVVMEWAPDYRAATSRAANSQPLTSAQEAQLNRALELFGVVDASLSDINSLAKLLEALDLDANADAEVIKAVLLEKNCTTVAALKNLIAQQALHVRSTNRYFVALSLLEAETLRGLLHAQTQANPFTSPNIMIALHVNNIVLDHSTNYVPCERYLRESTRQIFRFVDSELGFTNQGMSMVLRALQPNEPDDRRVWFEDVRQCRRRKQTELEKTAVNELFMLRDQYQLLESRATVSRIRTLISNKGMRARDAFRLFNTQHSGLLTCSELYGGLEWLGMQMTPEQIYTLVRSIDSDHDGLLSLEDFKSAFDDPTETTVVETVDFAPSLESDSANDIPIIPPKPIKELFHVEEDSPTSVDITPENLKDVKVKLHKQEKFYKVWTSHGTMSRTAISVWAPDIDLGMFKKNKQRVSLGVYANTSFTNPGQDKKNQRLIVEITDTRQLKVQHSDYLANLIGVLLPHPVRFRQVWNQQRGKEPFFAWKPIPPSNDFVCLGMVCTTTEDAPSRLSVRCLPRSWVVPSKMEPRLLWDDGGVGGRPGSVWEVNSMGLIHITQGHTLSDKEEFFELKEARFFLGTEEMELITGKPQSAQPPLPQQPAPVPQQ